MKIFNRLKSGGLVSIAAMAVFIVAGGRQARAAVDLRDGGAYYRWVTESSVYPGASLWVEGCVSNSGSTAAGPFYVGIYLSTDTTITTSDLRIGTVYYSSLGHAMYRHFRETFYVPSSTPPGPYYLGYYMDYRGQVAEGNENNNTSYLSSPMITILNFPPDKPVLQSPGNGVIGQSLTPTLTASAFIDESGHSHAASHWKVDDNSSFLSPAYNSGTTTVNKTSIVVPSGRLSANTVYYWSVRYRDSYGAWSSWASYFSFRTAAAGASGNPPNRPVLSSPAFGATGISRTPTLQSGAFSDLNGDSHAASQWQVDNSIDYDSPAFDSGETTTFKTSITVPLLRLASGAKYYWRVRYKDSTGLWSSWSLDRWFITKLRTVNDYDGDGKSDLTIYNPNNRRWRFSFSGGRTTNVTWGFQSTTTVCGDYDGDSKSDLAIFNNAAGLWSIRSMGGSGLANNLARGWAGGTTVAGDYDGDGKSDLAVYNEATGMWSIWSYAKNVPLALNLAWGWPGAKPVSGDYDGDGVSDLAVLDVNIGHWYIFSLITEDSIAWNLAWGWAGCAYVPGDFDGDGQSDLAVYDKNTSNWFIYSLPKKTSLAWYQPWGFAGATPVSGDYDGDGKTDMAVYNQLDGKWYIRTLSGTILVWDKVWGGNALIPVKP